MNSISNEQIINQIANTVVLIDADDVENLGQLLQLINQLDDPRLDQHVFEVGDVTERIILDDFDSVDEGLDNLKNAVVELQDAFEHLKMISEDEQEKKTSVISEQEEEMKRIEEEDLKAEKEKLEAEKKAKQEKEAKAQEEIAEAEVVTEEPKGEEKKAEVKSQAKPVVPAKPKAAVPAEVLKHPDYENYFESRDNQETILQTLIEDPELVQGFIEESTTNLQMIENGLLSLESNPNDLKLIDEIFRPFHTIKGVAGFLSLTEVNSFCHGFESVLDDARKGQLQVTDEMTDAVFEAIDALRLMIEAVAQAQSSGTYVPHGVDLDYFNIKLNVIRLGLTETAPVPAATSAVTKSATPTKAKDGEVKKPGAVEHSVRVSTQKMDALLDLVGELVLTQNMVTSNNTIKTSTDKRLSQDIGQLKRITTSLQDLSMSLRMVPIKDLFQKMNRIVRDLSKKSGKKIRLEYFGEDTEIDRNMVDELYEPMVHMIRNNCDHGLETPDERVANGKDETGTVTLNAFYRGGLVIIEITDDGRGINPSKIKKIAAERGLCRMEDDIPDKEIVNFIFHAGFSTQKQITDVSGRGVGMDVVRQAINSLRGNIEVITEVNKGTTMSLRLPLTLAIIDGVIVRIGEERFIIPTTAIKESLVCPPNAYNKVIGKGETVLIRDQVIPLLRVDRQFGITEAVAHPKDGILIVVESDGKEAAIPVNEMLDKQEIVIKSLGEGLNKIKGLAGGAIMSDGRVGLIIDVPTLLQNASAKRVEE